jgi:hypothetical protein
MAVAERLLRSVKEVLRVDEGDGALGRRLSGHDTPETK